MSRKPKMKWTEQMNKDILECKRKAKELTSSQNPPCNRNGRRKGYIEVMKELWDEKGYAHLELKSQNLRDQASRLEKLQGCVMDDYGEDARAVNADGAGATKVRFLRRPTLIIVRKVLETKIKTPEKMLILLHRVTRICILQRHNPQRLYGLWRGV